MRITTDANFYAQAFAVNRSAQTPNEAQTTSLSLLRGQSSDTPIAKQKKSDAQALSPEEIKQVNALKAIDRQVRAHEQAHMAAGGELVMGGASYSYQTGPDKQRYAVGGEVSIDTSPGRTPQETLAKAQRIQAAALAPADPSPQDRNVAAQAARMASEAAMALAAERQSSAGVVPTQNRPGIAAYQQGALALRTHRGAAQSINIFA